MSVSPLPYISGPFKVQRQIATGASSTVWSALNTESGELVALKLFHQQLVHDQGFSERLKREAEALQLLNHPNVVQLIRPWTFQNQFFLELEMIEGLTLREWSQQNPPQWVEPHIWILAQVARALGAAHEHQILHRDLKPDNILISAKGEVKLADFGLARSEFFRQKLTQTGSLVGSLAYMAPEAVEGQATNFSSDIFSFGILAYELLCGSHPFMDASGQILIKDLLAAKFESCTSRNAKIPHSIATLIECCLQKDPGGRPTSIWTVEAQLMDHLQSSSQLPAVKEWMKTGNIETLSSALSLKNQKLKSEIHAGLANGMSRSLVLKKVNEFHALFPDDPAFMEMMKSLAEPVPEPTVVPSRKRWGFVLLGLMSLPLMGGWLLYKSPMRPTTPLVPVQAESSAPMKAPVLPDKPVAPAWKTSPKPTIKPAAQKGQLRIMVDEGVRVFIDGRRLTSSQLANQKLKPGHYTILLEKDGFLPIERAIEVRPGKETLINARTETP